MEQSPSANQYERAAMTVDCAAAPRIHVLSGISLSVMSLNSRILLIIQSFD